MDAVVELEGVSYWYPNSQKPAIDDLSLRLEAGEFLLVSGSSGSGKSTFCRMLNGLVPNFSGGRMKGRVLVCGLDTRQHKTNDLAKKVGMVFQDPENQFVAEEVENEIAFGLENARLDRGEIRERVNEAAKALRIENLLGRRLRTLSGGEKQKVVLASATALRPELVVLDEPTSQIDPKSAKEFLESIARLNKSEKTTVVLAEHRIERVFDYATKALDLDQKKFGSPREVLATSNYVPPQVLLGEIRKPPALPSRKNAKTGYAPKSAQPRCARGRPVVEVRNLSKWMDGKEILKNVSFTLHEREFTAIVGLNGSGKTTLVRHINGLAKPTSGSVLVDGADTRNTATEELAAKVGFLSQNPNDYLHTETVREEIQFTQQNLGLNDESARLLDFFGLTGLSKSYPRDLSGGEREKTALASVLSGNPKVIVLDEPTRGVDHKSKKEFMRLLGGLRDEGKAILLVSHDVESFAGAVDRVIVIESGKIVADGSPRSVLPKTQHFKTKACEMFGDHYLTVEDVMEDAR